MVLEAGRDGFTDRLSWCGLAGKAWSKGSLLRSWVSVERGMESVVVSAGREPASIIASNLPSRYFSVGAFNLFRSKSRASSSLTPLSSFSHINLVTKCFGPSSRDCIHSLSFARRAGAVTPRRDRRCCRMADQEWPLIMDCRRSSSWSSGWKTCLVSIFRLEG